VSDRPAANDEDPFSIDFSIDLDVAHLARVENFLAGGPAHFSVDRAAAEALGDEAQSGLDGLRGVIEALRQFVARTVRLLATEGGMRQFLQVGMPTPTGEMPHHVALRSAPDARVVYTSYDPTTLAHVHALQNGAPPGAVAHVHARPEDPKAILTGAAATLDFRQPVVLILPTTLNVVPDDEMARWIVAYLRESIAPGSYVVLAHTSAELATERTSKLIARLNESLDVPYVLRSGAEIARFFDGFAPLEPGLVAIERWRGDGAPPILGPDRWVPIYGAVGRKP
jgi:hypothetical protein